MSEKEKLPPLERYIRILELLSAFPDGLSLTDVSAMADLPKGTVHRLLRTMQELELVTPTHAGASVYAAGRRLRRLAIMSAETEWVEAVVGPYLRELTADTGETSYITKMEGDTVRSIAMEAPDTPWRGFVIPGRSMHPHAAASAKAILAFQDVATIERALSGTLEKLTSKTNTSKAKVKEEYEQIRQTGFATCVGEIDEGLAAVAVPVFLRGSEVVFSLGITGPLNRILAHDMQALSTLMQKYATRIANGLSMGLARRVSHPG
ncbi:IclR family transcriptional regulator [Noviherbaspirillum sp.]|uniref:IclR family transcriptional regulator n=1 Tax=Noviherbaspirillum sp. TaxID=1926288 RepID=UPI002B4767B7|nr:IclR family transcriptional regulator C-terminal domain-containing protein [Noviherbaspirillum sp.]HJV82072.1 IclR family transcriptional regulator C-terminal domain-containing protein [Noviherbaspirillum sp.]